MRRGDIVLTEGGIPGVIVEDRQVSVALDTFKGRVAWVCLSLLTGKTMYSEKPKRLGTFAEFVQSGRSFNEWARASDTRDEVRVQKDNNGRRSSPADGKDAPEADSIQPRRRSRNKRVLPKSRDV